MRSSIILLALCALYQTSSSQSTSPSSITTITASSPTSTSTNTITSIISTTSPTFNTTSVFNSTTYSNTTMSASNMTTYAPVYPNSTYTTSSSSVSINTSANPSVITVQATAVLPTLTSFVVVTQAPTPTASVSPTVVQNAVGKDTRPVASALLVLCIAGLLFGL